MSKQTEAKEMYYIYKLSLNPDSLKNFKPEPYSTDAMMTMIISAKTDIEARMIAIEKEWGGNYPGWNESTAMFWGPTIVESMQCIQCVPIGVSFELKPMVICTYERHDTG